MDTTIAEIRELERREILELNQGARKARRDTLSTKTGKAQFAGLKRKAHERSKTR